MYQCPNCGGRLIFDISSQSMLCEHCNTHYNPYNLGEGNSAEESKEYDVTEEQSNMKYNVFRQVAGPAFLCVFILNVGLKRVIMGATISIALN